MISALFELLYYVINLFKWAVILAAVFSMLAAFGVLDTRNRMVWTIGDFLYRVTDPVLRPVRNILPNFGGIDLSPVGGGHPDPDRHPAAAGQAVRRDHLRHLAAAGLLTMFWRVVGDGVAVAVKVQPRARRPGLHGLVPDTDGERLAIARARTGRGRARQPGGLRRVGRRGRGAALAGEVAAGAASRRKTLRVSGDAASIATRLAAL